MNTHLHIGFTKISEIQLMAQPLISLQRRPPHKLGNTVVTPIENPECRNLFRVKLRYPSMSGKLMSECSFWNKKFCNIKISWLCKDGENVCKNVILKRSPGRFLHSGSRVWTGFLEFVTTSSECVCACGSLWLFIVGGCPEHYQLGGLIVVVHLFCAHLAEDPGD